MGYPEAILGRVTPRVGNCTIRIVRSRLRPRSWGITAPIRVRANDEMSHCALRADGLLIPPPFLGLAHMCLCFCPPLHGARSTGRPPLVSVSSSVSKLAWGSKDDVVEWRVSPRFGGEWIKKIKGGVGFRLLGCMTCSMSMFSNE